MLRALTVLIALAGPSAGMSAQEDDARSPSSRCSAAAQSMLDRARLPGLSAAVMRDGQLVCSVALGWAHRELEIPVASTTMFRLGSVSKPLSSIALGLLVQEGKIDLEAPVQSYAPGFPPKSGVVTTRLAAAHLSGLPQYEGRDFVNTTHYDSMTHALDKFKHRPLLFEPGERHHYSSYGWNLVGAVIEGAASAGFLEVMSRRVFEPLGLEHTSAELGGEDAHVRAQPYARVGGVLMRPPVIDQSDAWPSAGFLASTEDLVRFGDAVLSGRLLEPATRTLLWTRQKTSSGEATEYGLGWQHATKGGRPAIGHGGSHVGATADFWILPEQQLIVAVATNTNSSELSELVDELVLAVLGPRGGTSGGVRQ